MLRTTVIAVLDGQKLIFESSLKYPQWSFSAFHTQCDYFGSCVKNAACAWWITVSMELGIKTNWGGFLSLLRNTKIVVSSEAVMHVKQRYSVHHCIFASANSSTFLLLMWQPFYQGFSCVWVNTEILNFLINCCPFPACHKRKQLRCTLTEATDSDYFHLKIWSLLMMWKWTSGW